MMEPVRYSEKALAKAARSLQEMDKKMYWARRIDWNDVLARYSHGESIKSIARDYVVAEMELRYALQNDPIRVEQWNIAVLQRAWHAADRILDVADSLQPRRVVMEELVCDEKGRPVLDADDNPIFRNVARTVVPTNEEIRAGEVLIKALQWVAARFDPVTFGERNRVDMSVKVTHEDALREILDAETPDHGN